MSTRFLGAVAPAFALGLLALSACGDPADPCGADGACEVAGIDLVVETPEIVAWPGMRVDPGTGLPVVETGDSVSIEVTIRNRGDTRSDPVTMRGCTEIFACYESATEIGIPAIAPGRSYSTRLRVLFMRDFPVAHDSISQIGVQLSRDFEDAEGDNNYGTAEVFVGDARIGGAVTAPVEIRVGESLTIPVRIQNISRYATLPADTLFVCFEQSLLAGCSPAVGVMHTRATAAIPPGGVLIDTFTVTLLPGALGNGVERRRFQMNLAACIGRRDYDHPARAFYGCAAPTVRTDIFPDLDISCETHTIAPDTVVIGLTRIDSCNLRNGNDVEIWSFEAVEGERIHIELLDAEPVEAAMEVIHHDGYWHLDLGRGPFTFPVPHTGRYHIAVHQAGAYRLSLTRE